TAVVRPQRQVASRQLDVHCGRAADHLHPVLAERVADRHLAQTRVRAVLEARADRTTRGALTAARRAAVEPVLSDGDRRVGAWAHDRTIDHVAGLVVAEHVLAE